MLNRPFDTADNWFMTLLTFFMMLGTLLVTRRLLRAIFGSEKLDQHWGIEWLALGMGYMAYFDTILVLNRNLFYPYDITALFFFTLLVYLAYTGQTLWFTLAMIPAMLNKETAIMAVLVYFGLQFRPEKWKILTATCCGMAIVSIFVRVAQINYLRHISPGYHNVAQYQLHENMHQLYNPLFWASAISVFGFSYVAVILLWRYIPIRARLTVLSVSGLWLAGMTVVGVLREIRIFSELSILILLLIGLGVYGWLEEKNVIQEPAMQVLE